MNYSNKKNKLVYPAADRNKEPILNVLKTYLPTYFNLGEPLMCLEVSSGSGQHISHFAPNFPKITFVPSEFETDLLNSISGYAEECITKNIKAPLLIDITKDLGVHEIKKESVDIIYNANMMHISPYECTIGLFENAGKYLKANGIMITYGPYGINGIITPESNVNFDKSLRAQDPRWGIRDLSQLTSLGDKNDLFLDNIVDMPANNKCLIWKKVVKK